ncbi:hypothetical protein LZC95_28955 [Pendulispora brunnea]|uniref:Metallo-beta-lactamase domain-containing protein n=1 Tax=Pendulispora brunnea TaxID=2905690 RepID=A0ABZ2JVH1_9BACT
MTDSRLRASQFERRPAEISSVLTPDQAVAAAIILGAKLIVPIHYGVNGAEGYSELPNPEAALVAAASRRGIDVEVARPGDWLNWNGKRRG